MIPWYKDPIIVITLIVSAILIVVVFVSAIMGNTGCTEGEKMRPMMVGKVVVPVCVKE